MPAYYMSDVATGSDAALKLQQNMAAAPNVQQVEANKMQSQANTLQEQQTALQQGVATLEKTKLANLVAETGFKASEESRTKLKELTETPEFKTADDVKKLTMLASVQMQNGDVENGAKTLQSSELLETRNIAQKQKQLDVTAQEVGNAYGVISAIPDDKVDDFVKRMPAASRDALIGQVGQENWNSMTGTQKKEAAQNLMMNAKGQLANRLKEIEVEKQKVANESRERIARIQADNRLAIRIAGITARSNSTEGDMKDWALYDKRQSAIENAGRKTLEKLDEAVENAKGKMDKAWFFKGSETDEYNKAVAARDAFKKSQIREELNLALSAPKFPGREFIIENLKKEYLTYGGTEEEATPTESKPTTPAKPGAKPTPATAPPPASPAPGAAAKPGAAPSNKPATTPPKLTDAEKKAAIDAANKAIQQGADRNAVIKRLKDSGALPADYKD